jgi:hypothetical protein
MGRVMRLALILSVAGVIACGREAVPQSRASKPAVAPVMSVAPPLASVMPPLSSTPPLQAPEEPRESWGNESEEQRSAPKEVVAERKAFAEAYPPFPKLRRLPDFLSVDQALAMLPTEERDYVREEIHQQLEGGENDVLLGASLDEGVERLFALWVRGNLTQVLAVFDAGKLTGKRVISRGQPMLGELLEEADGPRLEILIERITTMSVCCLPMSLEVYRVTRRGILTQVLDFPRGHVEVGPGERWSFLNHFEFEDPRVVISSAYPGNQPTYELVFDPKSGRYMPTPATAKRLAEERRERERSKASGQLLGE